MNGAGVAQMLIVFGAAAIVGFRLGEKRRDIKQELIIAATVSALWVLLTGFYTYADHNFVFLGLNIFSWVAWTAAFVIIKEVYEALPKKNRLAQTALIWAVAIIVLEYVGYNIFGIQLTSAYPGFLGLDLLHVPLWAQIYYLTAGTAFAYITTKLGVK